MTGEDDVSARASELRWRWRILVLDLLLHLVECQRSGGGLLLREHQAIVGGFSDRAEKLRRDLERAG